MKTPLSRVIGKYFAFRGKFFIREFREFKEFKEFSEFSDSLDTISLNSLNSLISLIKSRRLLIFNNYSLLITNSFLLSLCKYYLVWIRLSLF